MRKLWQRACREAKLEGKTPHILRHTAGYQMAKAGVSQQLIMQVMNHKSLALSARYAHASTTHKLRIADKVFG